MDEEGLPSGGTDISGWAQPRITTSIPRILSVRFPPAWHMDFLVSVISGRDSGTYRYSAYKRCGSVWSVLPR